jgi:hypothetical protein
MYRFLDKRFYHKSSWEFDLFEFACEHVGVSRTYDTGELKRRLNPAIDELERVGFLEPLSRDERYMKLCPGKWRIKFVRREVTQVASSRSELQEKLSEKLIVRGVTPAIAAELVEMYPAEQIEKQIQNFDRRLSKSDMKELRNPAGFLVQAIRKAFVASTVQINKAKSVQSTRARATKSKSEPAADCIQQEVAKYLASLNSDQLQQLERQALEAADFLVQDGYRRSQKTGGVTHAAYRQMLLEREVRQLLSSEGEANTKPTKAA